MVSSGSSGIDVEGQDRSARAARWHMLLLMALALLIYGNTLQHDYTQDDAIVIYDNMFTRQGVEGIPGILKNDTFFGFFKEEGKAQLVSGGRYRPFTLVLFALEWELFGQNPFVGHLVSVLLYGLTCVMLYLLTYQLFQWNNKETYARYMALGASLLFLAHPVHTEVVANIKGRDEIVALLGSLAALYFSIRAFRENQPGLNILAGGLFFLALLSKENAITFLAIVPLTYLFFTKAGPGRLVVQALPFAVAALGFLVLRGSVIGWQFGDAPMELMNNPYLKWEDGRYVAFTAGERMATIIYTLGKYVQLLVFPHPLTHDYYPRHIDLIQWSDWRVIGSSLIYAGFGAACIVWSYRRHVLGYALFFYLATLSIASNIVFPIGTHMSERFLFMPSVGFVVILSVVMHRLSEVVGAWKGWPSSRVHLPALLAICILFLLYSAKTVQRNTAWKDNHTLFSTDIRTAPRSAKLQHALGGELVALSLEQEDQVKKEEMLAQAELHLQEAVRLHPLYRNAYLLLGNSQYYLGNYEASVQYYRRVLEISPGFQSALRNLQIALRDGGRYFGEKEQDLVRSASWLEEAYSLKPGDYETLRLLGVVHGMGGDAEKAVLYFEKAADQQPDLPRALYDLSAAYFQLGDTEKAQHHRSRAESLEQAAPR